MTVEEWMIAKMEARALRMSARVQVPLVDITVAMIQVKKSFYFIRFMYIIYITNFFTRKYQINN